MPAPLIKRTEARLFPLAIEQRWLLKRSWIWGDQWSPWHQAASFKRGQRKERDSRAEAMQQHEPTSEVRRIDYAEHVGTPDRDVWAGR